MLTDSVKSEVTVATSLPSDMTDSYCKREFIDPCAKDADGPSTAACDSAGWSTEVKKDILPIIKQEPEQVCYTVERYPMSCPVLLPML